MNSSTFFITITDLVRTLTSTTSELQGPLSLLASFYTLKTLDFYHRRNLRYRGGSLSPSKTKTKQKQSEDLHV